VSIARWILSAALLAWCAVPAVAQSPVKTAFNYDLASCPCETKSDAEQPSEVSEDSACDCQACGCDPCCCGGSGLLSCCLGDPWTMHDALSPCSDINYGGWVQAGYNDRQERLSSAPGDLYAMNDYPDHLDLHQSWFFVEKVAKPTCGGADWGFRFDILYGTDAQKTQAFGNEHNVWDVSLDHGVYGWAMPQLYGEVAYGDLSVKIGHFFALMGYEVVPAPQNFFFSHSLAMFNSEPFTQTGVLAAYKASEDLTIHAGWTLGWDTGFDQYDGGNSLHAGFISQVTDDVKFSYMCTAGNFGWRSAGQDGYSHSIVGDLALTDCLRYVVQSDLVHTEGLYADPTYAGNDVGIVQYLFYTLNDCWGLGTRLEWWKSNSVVGNSDASTSFYELTGGINYRPQANLVIRPEIRYDWSPTDLVANGEDYDEVMFGIDAIVTF
jgi:hypothetical protein